MKSRKQHPTPNEASINYWYKEALKFIKKFPLKSESDLNKLADTFALYSCRDYYGYLGAVPKTKLNATKQLLLERFRNSNVVKGQIKIK